MLKGRKGSISDLQTRCNDDLQAIDDASEREGQSSAKYQGRFADHLSIGRLILSIRGKSSMTIPELELFASFSD